MAEAGRDEELAVPFAIQLVSLPALVGGGVGAQIDGDVPDPAARAADQLRLAALHVDAAQHRALRAAVVVLDELDLDPELGEGVLAEGLDQEAALVTVDGGLDQNQVVELGRETLEAH